MRGPSLPGRPRPQEQSLCTASFDGPPCGRRLVPGGGLQVYHINCAQSLESKLQAEATKLSPNQRPLAERPHKHQFPLIRGKGTAQRALLREHTHFPNFAKFPGSPPVLSSPHSCDEGLCLASRGPTTNAHAEGPGRVPATPPPPRQGRPGTVLGPWCSGAGHVVEGTPKARSPRALVISESLLGRQIPGPQPASVSKPRARFSRLQRLPGEVFPGGQPRGGLSVPWAPGRARLVIVEHLLGGGGGWAAAEE